MVCGPAKRRQASRPTTSTTAATPIAEETFNGTAATFTALNGWAADGWRARKQGNLIYQYAYDPQGSVQVRHTDGSYTGGYAAYDRSTFEGYGALRAANKGSTGAGVGQHDPVGFGGQFGYYTDIETGLLCLKHRYYDPGTGRFLTRDPIGYKGGMNLYSLAGYNPVNRMDPSGYGGADDLEEETKEETPEEKSEEIERKMPNTLSPQYQREREIDERTNERLNRLSAKDLHRLIKELDRGKISPTNYPNPDPPMSAPPARYQPQSVEEVQRMRGGNTPRGRTFGSSSVEAHHRQQIPVRQGGVIDELTRETHRGPGNHTRHSGASQMTPTERDREIRTHYRRRGAEYLLPGEGI